MTKVGDGGGASKLQRDPLQELRDTQRMLARIADPLGLRSRLASVDVLERARAPATPWPSQSELARRLRERDEAHQRELEGARRGEVPADPMPREWPATIAASVELEHAESRFRIAHFARLRGEPDAWARWLSMRETAFAAALCALAIVSARASDRAQHVEEYAARVNRAQSWGSAAARAKAIRCALYALLEAYRRHPDDDDADNIAASWALEAPELGALDLLRDVRGVSLARVLEAWRCTAKGGRNRGASVYALLSAFFRRVAGLQAVHEATIETETRDFRRGWNKPKRAMPRTGGKKGKR